MTSLSQPESLLQLRAERCRSCTHCIRVCPTEAIRIRKGKASVMRHRCIQCGLCLTACPHGAWEVRSRELDEIKKAGSPIAFVDPSVLWQGGMNVSPQEVMEAFLKIGFQEAYELNEALIVYRRAIEGYLASGEIPRPAIGSGCPAVIQLVQVKYPSLTENLIPLVPPFHIAAAIWEASSGGLKPDGALFYIAPCLALAEAVKDPLFSHPKYAEAINFSKIFNELRSKIQSKARRNKADSPPALIREGMKWAASGEWIESLSIGKAIVVDGIHHVGAVLDRVENGVLEDIQFIDAWACPTGCFGGPLLIEIPHVARSLFKNWGKIKRTTSKAKKFRKTADSFAWETYRLPQILTPRSGMRLDENMGRAMAKLREIDALVKKLPGIDCGSCGCPNCLALAEDIVQGFAGEGDCRYSQGKKKEIEGSNQ